MDATVIQCDMHAIASAHERGHLGRILAARLCDVPGFVAFIALDAEADGNEGSVTALCIFEDRAGTEAAGHAIEQWQREYPVAVGSGIKHFGTGAVIVQKGF